MRRRQAAPGRSRPSTHPALTGARGHWPRAVRRGDRPPQGCSGGVSIRSQLLTNGRRRWPLGWPQAGASVPSFERSESSSSREGGFELFHALALDRLGQLVVVDAGARQLAPAACAPRPVPRPTSSRGVPCSWKATTVSSGIVLTVSGPDQLVHVERVRVGRVLGRGRGPQHPLRRRALARQVRPALPVEGLLVVAVGELGVGDREAALQVVVARRSRPSSRSPSVSMRETKKLATDATLLGSPPSATSRSRPRM